MKSDRRVSIVILTYNNLRYTRECIAAIQEHTQGYEIVVVDNASSDGTVEYLKDLSASAKNVRLVLNPENRGFAVGCNQGVEAARYEALCMLNNDAIPHAHWLEQLRTTLAPGVGVVGAKLMLPEGTLQHCGIEFAYRDQPSPHFWPYHRFLHFPEEIIEANVAETVPAVTGACMLTTRRIWHAIGGMDEGYLVANFEDVDFNLKVWQLGESVMYQPKARLTHYWGKTTQSSELGALGGQHFGRNFERLMGRWYGFLRAKAVGLSVKGGLQ